MATAGTYRARDMRDRDEPTAFVAAWTTTPANFDVVLSDPEASGSRGRPSMGVYVGTAGHLDIEDLHGTATTLSNVPVGFHRMQITYLASSSTAQDVVVYY